MSSTDTKLPADFWTRSYITHPKSTVGTYQQLGLKSEIGFGIGDYSLLSTLVPGTSVYQLMVGNLSADQAVLQLRPKAGGTESTLSLFLSEEGSYDCYADISLNRLNDPSVPILATFLRGDGFAVPKWRVDYKGSGSYTNGLDYDPTTGMFTCKTGTEKQKLTEISNPNNLIAVDSSGSYYVPSTASNLPVAENGIITHFQNPYVTTEGCQVYQSFTNSFHRYVRTLTGGSWYSWQLVTVT